jgi:hypothetical protein
MPYLGKVELKSSNIKRWTGVPGAVSAITHSTLGFVPFNEPSTFITVNGVGQHNSAFSLSPSQITFSSAFDVLDEVEVTCIIDVGQPISSADDTVGIPQLKTSDGTAGQVLTTDGSGNLSFSSKSVETLASMGVTSSTAELNILDGVTSTAAELNILDGVTSTAAELNILDGVTSSAAELNYSDGVTSAIQTQLDAKETTGAITRTASINMADNVLQRPELKDYSETMVAMPANDVDLSAGNVFTKTISGAQTLTFSNPPATGKGGAFTLILTNGGSATVTWPTTVDWAAATAPTLTAAGVDVLTFTTIDAGTIWYGIASGLAMA